MLKAVILVGGDRKGEKSSMKLKTLEIELLTDDLAKKRKEKLTGDSSKYFINF